jgi:hypothetical protein
LRNTSTAYREAEMGDKLVKPGGNNPLPALPTMFEKLAPIDIPQLEYDHGLFSGWKHNRKMEQIARSEELQAQISDDRLRQVRNNGEMIITTVTFSKKLEATLAEYNHEINHAKHLDDMDSLERLKMQEVVRDAMLKNSILQKEDKDLEITLKMKHKDMGYDTENEDR